MHIGFRKDFSKKRRVLVEGAWGGVRDKYKVGSLNYFCILATYLLILFQPTPPHFFFGCTFNREMTCSMP